VNRRHLVFLILFVLTPVLTLVALMIIWAQLRHSMAPKKGVGRGWEEA
jgi:hypothetical protein